MIREQSFHSAAISDDENSPPTESESPSSSKPSAPPSSSKPTSKAHHKPHASQSIGSVAAEMMASSSQFLKASEQTNKTCLDLMQSKEERAKKRLQLEEEKMKSDKELKEKEMKVKQAQEIIANERIPAELKQKAADFLMHYFSF